MRNKSICNKKAPHIKCSGPLTSSEPCCRCTTQTGLEADRVPQVWGSMPQNGSFWAPACNANRLFKPRGCTYIIWGFHYVQRSCILVVPRSSKVKSQRFNIADEIFVGLQRALTLAAWAFPSHKALSEAVCCRALQALGTASIKQPRPNRDFPEIILRLRSQQQLTVRRRAD